MVLVVFDYHTEVITYHLQISNIFQRLDIGRSKMTKGDIFLDEKNITLKYKLRVYPFIYLKWNNIYFIQTLGHIQQSRTRVKSNFTFFSSILHLRCASPGDS